jgi:NifU-like protein involved in Fe-S cluster formation
MLSPKGAPALSLSQIITEAIQGKTVSEPLNKVLVSDSMILLIPYHQLCLFMGVDINQKN